jgi:Rieske Fe-S protein
MNRRNFIRQSCIACITGIAASELLQACTVTKYTAGIIKNDYMLVPGADFLIDKNKPGEYRKYIVVQNELLKSPICIYRFSDVEYEALWLQCTHQGAELQVLGDKLQCPAHGSEFSNRGIVQNGPANKSLRKFPVTVEGNQLKISLK